MRSRRAHDCAVAAGQDGVLCLRSESRQDRMRDRQRRTRRSRPAPRLVLAGRGQGSGGWGPRGFLPGGRWAASHGESGDRHSRFAGAGRSERHRVDLRPVAGLRSHQRRLPDLMTRKNAGDSLSRALDRAEGVLRRLEAWLPPPPPPPDWSARAFRWRKRGQHGFLQGIADPQMIKLDYLVAIDEQKRVIDGNTRQFVAGLPANNVLLTGSRGTGKSSLVKAMLPKYGSRGLRLIEVDKADLIDVPDIVDSIEGRPERFIVFCDDLSFDANEPGYMALKVMLDGTIAAASPNMLIYATSNRRHLLPEYMSENLETKHLGEEVHPGESVEEKISLSERFGLWISFYPFSQDDYLAAVAGWLAAFDVPAARSRHDAEMRQRDALQFALQRGSRSGRIAWQFARGYAGAAALQKKSRST